MRIATKAVLGVLVLLTSRGTRVEAQSAPAGSPPGQLIGVFGHRIHIRCVGPANASPTVVLEAGGGGFSSTWSRVQELLAPSIRSCAYDRAGLGWSERGPGPRTMRQEVLELHELLAAAGVAAPIVLVGHSAGGLDARIYTERYGRDVAGMVLVDATHENTVLFNLRANRWVRIRELAPERAIPEPVREGKPATGYDPATDFFADELRALHDARQADPRPLGERPLFVLAAGKRPAPPGTPDSRWRELSVEKDAQARDLATLSRNAVFVVDSTSGHQIPTDNPAAVARAIERVVEAARTKRRLVP